MLTAQKKKTTLSLQGLGRLSTFGAAGTGLWLQWSWLKATVPPEKLNELLAERFRRTLGSLGPTFMKLGQWLSLRSDFLPKEFCHAFESFFDNVEPVSTAKIVAAIEAELGDELENLFLDFDEKPIGVASLGQVHRARLFDGTDVIIKVQRPHLDKIIRDDMNSLQFIAAMIGGKPKFAALNLNGMIQELGVHLRRELDYRNEAHAAELFRKNHLDEPMIAVPKIFWELTTNRVLTMEYMKGYKVLNVITAIEAEDKRYLARLAKDKIDIESVCEFVTYNYIKQQVIDGYFHADPHPSNLIIMPGGRICYIDFGLMGSMSGGLKEAAIEWLTATVTDDPVQITAALLKLGRKQMSAVERKEFTRRIRLLMKRLKTSLAAEYTLSQMYYDMLVLSMEYQLHIPQSLLLFVKGVSALDGVARRLSPDFSYTDSAQRAFRKVMFLDTVESKTKTPDLGAAAANVLFGHAADYLGALTNIFARYELSPAKGGDDDDESQNS